MAWSTRRFYRGDSKRQLQQEIEIIRGVQHKKIVCMLDEAHLLEKETLEEFRFLLNYRFDSMSPMAVVLVGQTCHPWTGLRQNSISQAIWITQDVPRRSLQPKRWMRFIKHRPESHVWSTGSVKSSYICISKPEAPDR